MAVYLGNMDYLNAGLIKMMTHYVNVTHYFVGVSAKIKRRKKNV